MDGLAESPDHFGDVGGLDHLFGGRFPIGVSLGIISAVIATSILWSLAFPKRPAPPPERPSGPKRPVAREP